MSVRLSVILLAVLVIISITIALFMEWQVKHVEIESAEYERNTLIEIRSFSQLVHLLQKERGMAAGHLAGHDKQMHALHINQKQLTDQFLNGPQTLAQSPAIREKLNTLIYDLSILRKKIKQKEVSWLVVRQFYTSWITALLDETSRMALPDLPADLIRMVGVINHLAVSREKLGQIRAMINRFYTTQSSNQPDLINVAVNYGAFSEHLRVFRQDTSKHGANAFEKMVDNDTFRQVIDQIKESVSPRGLEFSSSTAVIWWRQATMIIDAMQNVETVLFDKMEQRLQKQVTKKRHDLYGFSFVAITILLTVLALTMYIVLRMLRAMSILMNKLNQVMNTEDFGVRLPSKHKDEFGLINLSINSLLNYTEQIIHQKEIIANTDLLTGLPNRRTILDIAGREFRRDNRYKTGIAIIFCDIDHFKKVNDQFGHGVGDKLLAQFANLLIENIRESDIAGRWGGEEFLVLVSSGAVEEASLLAEKLRQQVEKLAVPPVSSITCSFGVATRLGNESFESLCERADESLYSAKASGRNKVVIANTQK
jgi:diguanylate cyclase (GGDEF)-like protein